MRDMTEQYYSYIHTIKLSLTWRFLDIINLFSLVKKHMNNSTDTTHNYNTLLASSNIWVDEIKECSHANDVHVL